MTEYDINAIRAFAWDLDGEVKDLTNRIAEGRKCSKMGFSQADVLGNVQSYSEMVECLLEIIKLPVFPQDDPSNLRSVGRVFGEMESDFLGFVNERRCEDGVSEDYRNYARDLRQFQEGISCLVGDGS